MLAIVAYLQVLQQLGSTAPTLTTHPRYLIYGTIARMVFFQLCALVKVFFVDLNLVLASNNLVLNSSSRRTTCWRRRRIYFNRPVALQTCIKIWVVMASQAAAAAAHQCTKAHAHNLEETKTSLYLAAASGEDTAKYKQTSAVRTNVALINANF